MAQKKLFPPDPKYSKSWDLDDLPLKDLLTLVQENPGLLRRPIMIDEKRLQVGFNEDEIRRFLPRDVRQLELRQAQLMAGL